MIAAMRTSVGKVRPVNEDAAYMGDGLYVIADGMGGHQAGEVASKIAVETLRLALSEDGKPTIRALILAVLAAGEIIRERSGEDEALRGMGTTLTALWFCEHQALIAQVGDSRAYLLREGVLRQCTHDHSVVAELVRAGLITAEEARRHPRRNLITRSLGGGERGDPDVFEFTRQAGDRWLLCSDGLTDGVTDDELRALLQGHDVEAAADALLSLALARGGGDNITLLLVEDEGVSA